MLLTRCCTKKRCLISYAYDTVNQSMEKKWNMNCGQANGPLSMPTSIFFKTRADMQRIGYTNFWLRYFKGDHLS